MHPDTDLSPADNSQQDLLPQSSKYQQLVRSRLLASAELNRQVSEHCLDAILAAATLMAESLRAGGKILLCGNGGSAADCQHIAAELVNWLTKDFTRPGLAAIALTTDTSFITAHANDCGFEGVFARQVQAIGKPGDVLIGISTSGNSANVMQAVIFAKSLGMKAIALTGSGGKLTQVADVTIAIPSVNTQHIQESHLAVEHILCELVERILFPERDASGIE
ncbi:SIS domain-containing protein [Tumidithrix elongata RA019]|uniref:Phosphoheptose isomerase n=1 Tax=Tumidithrix elongata BACA0141 TaxID=2716417 RepID=A0AAW9PR23_9CYAN|nr:SIS domain-containing protein [Tumidithrix elongata RA019]